MRYLILRMDIQVKGTSLFIRYLKYKNNYLGFFNSLLQLYCRKYIFVEDTIKNKKLISVKVFHIGNA